MKKRCTKCKKFKKASAFHRKGERLRNRCIKCTRKARILKDYGLTWKQYKSLVADGCMICGTHTRLCVDHDHKTGEVRGILCTPCNRRVGTYELFKDRIEVYLGLA